MMLISQKFSVLEHDFVFTKKFTAVHVTVRSPQILGREIW